MLQAKDPHDPMALSPSAQAELGGIAWKVSPQAQCSGGMAEKTSEQPCDSSHPPPSSCPNRTRIQCTWQQGTCFTTALPTETFP